MLVTALCCLPSVCKSLTNGLQQAIVLRICAIERFLALCGRLLQLWDACSDRQSMLVAASCCLPSVCRYLTDGPQQAIVLRVGDATPAVDQLYDIPDSLHAQSAMQAAAESENYMLESRQQVFCLGTSDVPPVAVCSGTPGANGLPLDTCTGDLLRFVVDAVAIATAAATATTVADVDSHTNMDDTALQEDALHAAMMHDDNRLWEGRSGSNGAPSLGTVESAFPDAATGVFASPQVLTVVRESMRYDKRCSPVRPAADSWSKILFQCAVRTGIGAISIDDITSAAAAIDAHETSGSSGASHNGTDMT